MDYLLKEELKYYNQDLIAKSGIQTLYSIVGEEGDAFHKLISARDTLLNNNPENVVLKNSVDIFLSGLTKQGIREETKEKRDRLFRHLADSSRHIADHAAKKTKENSSIFFHSINSNIYEIARHMNETRKVNMSVLEGANSSINKTFASKVGAEIYQDLHIRDALSRSDLCMMGAESYYDRETVVKKGSYLIAREAKEQGVPVYVCLHTLKHGRHKIDASVFEKLPETMITGYITEHGIFDSKNIDEEMHFFRKLM